MFPRLSKPGRGGAAVLVVVAGVLGGCPSAPPAQAWALAVHGGAGTIPRDLPPAVAQACRDSLARALAEGRDRLAAGQSSVEVVEAVIRILEDDPLFNAGRGAVLSHEGRHELDASLMRGQDLACGAVAGVRTVRHPISLARRVMEQTRHVLLAGAGAEELAAEQGLELVDNTWFTTPRRVEQLHQKLGRPPPPRPADPAERDGGDAADVADADKKGTVGVVALDRQGHLAAGTSTGGLTAKRWGRVGDSPIIGAGTYADDRAAAISCTGTGEEFIRHGVAHSVVQRMLLKGEDVQTAADHVVFRVLKPDDGGLIALDARGRVAFAFNSAGMYRAVAAADGRFQIGIWDELVDVPPPARAAPGPPGGALP